MSSSHLAERQGNHLANETKAIGSVAFQNPLFPKGDNDFDNSPITTEVVAIRDLVIVSRMDRADVSSAPNFNLLRNRLKFGADETSARSILETMTRSRIATTSVVIGLLSKSLSPFGNNGF